MWRRLAPGANQLRPYHTSRSCWNEKRCNVIEIDNATFYRNHPAAHNELGSDPALFPGLSFSLPVSRDLDLRPQYWSVISTSSLARTAFLQVLAGQHVCIPPTARSYPYLSENSKSTHHAIKYVGFDAERGNAVGGTAVRGAYLSARYESRREATDYSVHDYLTGHTELNALEREENEHDRKALADVVTLLNLSSLLHMPVSNLSNGQTRRARIAKALMAQPEVLLLDGPFMGLDPNTLNTMASVLQRLAEQQRPRLIMSLRPEDGVPDWVSHLVVTDESLQVLATGRKNDILADQEIVRFDKPLSAIVRAIQRHHGTGAEGKLSKDGCAKTSPPLTAGEALVEMQGVRVSYGSRTVLGDWNQSIDGEEMPGLWWNLSRGQRCGVFGANGSGKTTLLSLITSDHPQAYSLPVRLFGRSRLPGPNEVGISLFDLQHRMGHSSPEVHAFFPKQLSVRRTLESAWADTPMSRPTLSADADQRVDAFLRWFAKELNPNRTASATLENFQKTFNDPNLEGDGLDAAQKAYDTAMADHSDIDWAKQVSCRELSFSSQRLLLFLRAIIAQPDLVILDEALSGIDERVRDKALLFLSHGETISAVQDGVAEPSVLSRLDRVAFEGLSPEQALLVISHAKEDVPGCMREWICLEEPGEGKPPRLGTLPGPLELNPHGWDQIWGRTT